LRIGPADVGRLLGDPTLLVDHTGTGISPADVSGVHIRSDAGDLRFTRTLGRWMEASRGEASPGSVEQFVDTLCRTRAAQVALHDRYPDELEVAIVTLLDRHGGPLDTVRILQSETPEGLQWAMENGDRVLRILPADTQLFLQPVEFGLSGTP